jgi:N-acyl-phosphatidylethanolamine-hydrolysing phospholipase D
VRAHCDLGARRSLGMHFGTFQLTDEAIDAPPRALQAACAAADLPPDAFVAPAFGETRTYPIARRPVA